MFLISTVTVAGFLLGSTVPLSTRLWGYLACVVSLFGVLLVTNAFVLGFVGPGIADNLLYFDGSLGAYIGYNLQISYRAFAAPLLATTLPVIYRLTRTPKTAQG